MRETFTVWRIDKGGSWACTLKIEYINSKVGNDILNKVVKKGTSKIFLSRRGPK